MAAGPGTFLSSLCFPILSSKNWALFLHVSWGLDSIISFLMPFPLAKVKSDTKFLHHSHRAAQRLLPFVRTPLPSGAAAQGLTVGRICIPEAPDG